MRLKKPLACGMLTGMSHSIPTRTRWLVFLLVLVVLIPFYLATLQTIPNGSDHYFMIDVGEDQIVLNHWGTLHYTGYPVYVILGNLLVTLFRIVGVAAVTAPALTSLLYGILSLALLYNLAYELLGQYALPPSPRVRLLLPAGLTLLFGFTRTMWVHNSIAEIYTFGLALLLLLLWIALCQPFGGGLRQLYTLALVGGIGVFHHRAILMAAPALVYAVWPVIRSEILRTAPGQSVLRWIRGVNYRALLLILLLGLAGFIPYIYLPLRANAGASWVYGEPGTWTGFWDQFWAREAARFIGVPTTSQGLVSNLDIVNTVLVTDLTLPGLLLGLVGLTLALFNPTRRRAAITFWLVGGVAYVFHVLVYTDILSALILPITLALAFGWFFLAEWVIQRSRKMASSRDLPLPIADAILLMSGLVLGLVLVTQNLPFIEGLTRNPAGLETIEIATGAPESTLMLDWGPRHFAVGFAHDVLGDLPEITLVTHNADFKSIVAQGKLVTADFTFYNRPISWWQERLGAPVYLRAAAPHLVEISTQPILAEAINGTGIQALNPTVVCEPERILLTVDWLTTAKPDHDLSVFVHLLDTSGTVLSQGDQSAPVFGWRPLTTWEAGEIVRDIYILPRVAGENSVNYGFYRQLPSGEFVNEETFDTAVTCDG